MNHFTNIHQQVSPIELIFFMINFYKQSLPDKILLGQNP